MVETLLIPPKIQQKPVEKLTWEAFQEKYLILEDGYKYEWVNGGVVKTEKSMNKKQFHIQKNLNKFFAKLDIQTAVGGDLIVEGDTFFDGNHRRPDIAYYTDEQIEKAKKDEDVVPQFVIEVISSYDQINLVHKKMQDYRAAKVPVVWHIFPLFKEVHVYQGLTMKICKGEDICTAEAAVKGFSMTVNDIFK